VFCCPAKAQYGPGNLCGEPGSFAKLILMVPTVSSRCRAVWRDRNIYFTAMLKSAGVAQRSTGNTSEPSSSAAGGMLVSVFMDKLIVEPAKYSSFGLPYV